MTVISYHVKNDLIRINYLLLLSILLLAGCQKGAQRKDEKPLARVFDHYLYNSDLTGVIPDDLSGDDSARVARDFIEKWVSNQLLLNKAEMNLTDEEKDVEQQIQNYRSSLLIYAYQQSYLQQKLDTVVKDEEIKAYFNENQSNFILGQPLMKGLFIRVPVNAPEIYKVRQWYRSDDAENLKQLEGYCYNHATVYDHFSENWVDLNEVLRMIPDNGNVYENTLRYRKYLEAKDKDFYYFLNVKELAPEGTVSPFELVKEEIIYIILNKRKITLINELEANVYADAQNRGQFTIY